MIIWFQTKEPIISNVFLPFCPVKGFILLGLMKKNPQEMLYTSRDDISHLYCRQLCLQNVWCFCWSLASPWDQKGGTGLESLFAFPFPQKAKTFKESIINPHLTILYSSMCKILEKLVHSFNVTCLCGVKYIQYPADKTRHQTKLHRDKYGLEDESTFSLKWVTCHENKYILGLLIMFRSNRDPTMNSIQSTSVLFI